MATKPMMMDDEASEAPESADAEMQEGEGDGSYCIEITVKPDGTFTVATESADAEAAEGGESEEAGESFDNIKDALTAVLDIVKGKGAATSQAPISAAQERAQMMAGFNSGKA